MSPRKNIPLPPIGRGKPKSPCPVRDEDGFCMYQPDGHKHLCGRAVGGHFTCGQYLGVKAGRIVIEGVDITG